MLRQLQPDVLFSTHQRSLDGSVVVEAARSLEIPTLGAVYSWDNLPKARLLVRTDRYVLWSEFMKQEMATYYPEIAETRLFVTGTPQFEFYFNPSLRQERGDFFAEWGLDANK